MSQAPKKSKTVNCSSCGMKLNVLPNMKKIKCKHCGIENPINSDISPKEPPKPPKGSPKPPEPKHDESNNEDDANYII